MKTLISLLILSRVAVAAPCPAAVTSAVATRFPRSTLGTCKAEKAQFEVKVTKADGGKAEVEVSAAGDILLVEEVVPVDKVPAAVMKAFSAKYPKAKADRAEKQTPTKGLTSYELAFSDDGKRKEATFDERGKFVEEE
ncbi:MAG: PepSY-like domain-containing protein [Kofleriaceae bacterium]